MNEKIFEEGNSGRERKRCVDSGGERIERWGGGGDVKRRGKEEMKKKRKRRRRR